MVAHDHMVNTIHETSGLTVGSLRKMTKMRLENIITGEMYGHAFGLFLTAMTNPMQTSDPVTNTTISVAMLREFEGLRIKPPFGFSMKGSLNERLSVPLNSEAETFGGKDEKRTITHAVGKGNGCLLHVGLRMQSEEKMSTMSDTILLHSSIRLVSMFTSSFG